MPGQRHQRHDAAFAVVIGTQDKGHIFDGNHKNQRPENQGKNPQDVIRCGGHVVAGETLLQGIQRTGADIPIHHAQRSQRQAGHGLFIVSLHDLCAFFV